MKKTISIILAVVIIFATFVAFTAFSSASGEPVVTVKGYDVASDDSCVQVYYLDNNGSIVSKDAATQLVIKNKGPFVMNGQLIEAGANGKAILTLALPVTYDAPTEVSVGENESLKFDETDDTSIDISDDANADAEDVGGLNVIIVKPENNTKWFTGILSWFRDFFHSIRTLFFGWIH